MARYRTIDIRIWMDAKFMSLDEGSQLLFIYLLTCPQVNQIGTIPMSPSVLAAYLKKPVETVSERLRNLSDMGLIRVDNGNLIWICNFLKYNAPMNPNCAKGMVAFFDEIPDCPLVDEVAEAVVKACEIKGSDYVKAVLPSLKKYLDRRKKRNHSETVTEPYRNQEQEQEQDIKDVSDDTSSSANANVRECESAEDNQTDLFEKGVAAATVGRTPAPKNGQTESKPLSGLEHHPAPKVAPNPADAHPEIASETPQIGESDPADAPAPKSAKRNPPVPYQKVVDLYNAKCTPALAAARLTDKRKDDIRKRWHEMQEYTGAKTEEETLAEFGKYFDRISRSDFLKGLKTDFKADFPWLMQRGKIELVFEGRYDSREHAAIERNGHKGAYPLPDHLNPHLRFDEAYYTKENPFKPDGSLNWKD